MTAAAADLTATTVTLQEQINCQQSLTDMLSQQQLLTKSDITTLKLSVSWVWSYLCPEACSQLNIAKLEPSLNSMG